MNEEYYEIGKSFLNTNVTRKDSHNLNTHSGIKVILGINK